MTLGSYRLDVFIVAYFLTASHVGWYAIAFTVAEILWFLPNAIRTALFPRTAVIGDEQANYFTPLACRQWIILMLPALVASAASAWFFIPLIFGMQFRQSVLPFYLLLPGVATLGLSKLLSADLRGRGFPQYSSLAAAIALIVTIVADVILIPKMGIAGAAIASSLAYTSATLLVLIFFLRLSKISLSSLLIPRIDDLLVLKRLGSVFFSISRFKR